MPTAYERFMSKFEVDPITKCWNWIAANDGTGYGRFYANPKHVRAHRWSYEYFRHPISPGLQIDHLCRNRACVNPDHLDPVTPRTNTMRGFSVCALRARQTHCIHGHKFTPANTVWDRGNRRACRTCRERRHAARYAAGPERNCALCGEPFRRVNHRKNTPKYCSLTCAAKAPHPGRKRPACKHGHRYTPENTIVRRDGGRECRRCKNIANQRHKARKRAAA